MKLKKLFTLSFAILALAFYSYGQVEEAEAPMFGGTRGGSGMSKAQVHDFKEVSGKTQSYQFKIKNYANATMHIIDVKIPEKVGVTIINKSIKKDESAVIVVTIDPTIMDKGKFIEKIIVVAELKEPGIITKKEITFAVAGVIK